MQQDKQEGHFIRHEPCEACGSSDAKAVYSNGSAYCFSCETWFNSENETQERRKCLDKKSNLLLTNLKYSKLNSRKINEDTVRKYSYAYGKYKGEVVQVAPYRDHHGNLCAQHIRTKDKQFRWLGHAKRVKLFGQHLWQTGKRLVITEGEIDCMSVAQMFNLNWPVVSVPNGAQSAKKYIKQNIEFIEGFNEVVFAFDNDQDGQDAVAECAMLVTPGKAKVANFHPFKDANEMLQKGKGGDIPKRIFNAKEWRPDGIIPGSDISFEELQKEDEDAFGFDTLYPKLNDMINGLRKRELYMITSGTGMGKSTLVKELGWQMATNHSLTVGHVALEENVKKSALSYIAIDQNVPFGDLYVDRSIIPEEDLKESYEKLIANNRINFYDHFGSLDSQHLMAKLKYLATGLDVDFIILDHISIVVSGMDTQDERKTIDKLMTNLRSLVENTGVGVIAISHLKKPHGKKSHEEGGRVSLNELRGSGSIKQLSDVVIALERNQQGDEPNKSLIRVLKGRLFGNTGPADKCKYNAETGRLLPHEETDIKDFSKNKTNNEEEINFNEEEEEDF